MSTVTLRPATAADLPFMADMLYEAATVGWTLGGIAPPPQAEILAEPHNARYIENWGRTGDAGVIAEDHDRARIGAAWYRLYAPDERGDGIMAWPGAPEVAIAVRPDARGTGSGRALLDALAQAARAAPYARLVLSVDPRNPAVRLYERCGYRIIDGDQPHAGTSLIMEQTL